MPDKPSQLPRWADVGGAITEPLESKKNVGWLVGDQPPAQYENWLMNLIYQWMQYLNDPNQMTFGGGLLSTAAQAILARITMVTAANATLAYTRLGTFGSVNVYIGASDGTPSLAFAVNAQFGTAGTWTKVTTSQLAALVLIARNRIQIGTMPSAQNTAWTNAFVVGDGTTSGWGRIWDTPIEGGDDTTSLADIARIALKICSTSGVERVLLAEFRHATLGPVRLYYLISDSSTGDAGGLEITVNASWSNANNLWSNDFTGRVTRLTFGLARFMVTMRDSQTAGTTFGDASWTATPINFTFQTAAPGAGAGDETLFDVGNGVVRFKGTQASQASDANPPATAAIVGNSQHAKNIVKAYAYGTIDSAGAVTIQEGYNISSITTNTGSDTVTANFTVAMQSANYAVVYGGLTGSYLLFTTALNTGNFSFQIYNAASGVAPAVVNLGSATASFAFVVLGRQDT